LKSLLGAYAVATDLSLQYLTQEEIEQTLRNTLDDVADLVITEWLECIELFAKYLDCRHARGASGGAHEFPWVQSPYLATFALQKSFVEAFASSPDVTPAFNACRDHWCECFNDAIAMLERIPILLECDGENMTVEQATAISDCSLPRVTIEMYAFQRRVIDLQPVAYADDAVVFVRT
jgi:hypothetical protein